MISNTGMAARWYQLGLQMRPFFARNNLWTYPAFGAAFGSFGYWLAGVEERQVTALSARKAELLEKRARKALKDAQAA